MSILKGRKAIVIGDRDGVPGMAIAACARERWRRSRVLLYRVLRLNGRRCYGSGESEESQRSSWSSTEQKTLWFCWVLPRARVPVWQPRP